MEDIKRRDPLHTANFIKETIEVWQRHSTTDLTVEDAHAIIRNMTAFITLLAEWEQAVMEGDKNKNPIDESHR
jgi:hypothetical protein